MRKFIVPTQGKTKEWQRLFDEVFRDEQFQTAMFQTLVTLAMWLNNPKLRNTEYFIDLLETIMEMSMELFETGSISEYNTDAVAMVGYEFTVSLADFLRNIDIVKPDAVMKFDGFIGNDIIVKILDKDEADETLKIPIDDLESLSG